MSFRIPTSVQHANGKGYIEDRRPASNIDAYLVSAMLVDTGVLAESKSADLKAAYAKWLEFRHSEQLDIQNMC